MSKLPPNEVLAEWKKWIAYLAQQAQEPREDHDAVLKELRQSIGDGSIYFDAQVKVISQPGSRLDGCLAILIWFTGIQSRLDTDEFHDQLDSTAESEAFSILNPLGFNGIRARHTEGRPPCLGLIFSKRPWVDTDQNEVEHCLRLESRAKAIAM